MTTKAAQHKAAQLEKRLRNAPEFKDLIAGGLLTIWCYADGVSIVTQAELEGEEATDYNGDGLGAFALYEEARKTIGELVRRHIELLANEAAVRNAHDAEAAANAEPTVGETVTVERVRGLTRTELEQTTVTRLTQTQIIVELDGKERRFYREAAVQHGDEAWHREVSSRVGRAKLIRTVPAEPADVEPAEAADAAAAEALQEAAANHDDEDTFTARYGIVHADKDGRALRVIILDGLQFTAHALNELAYAALDEWAGRYTRAAVTLGRHGVTADGHVAVQATEDRIVPA